MKNKVFTYITDPGHGWLKVHVRDVAAVGMKPEDFSRCSYRSRAGTTLYLEEDCDAPKFIAAWRAKNGAELPIAERYVNRFDRSLPAIY